MSIAVKLPSTISMETPAGRASCQMASARAVRASLPAVMFEERAASNQWCAHRAMRADVVQQARPDGCSRPSMSPTRTRRRHPGA
jgi:hypothetical protein